jgi:hypothetical protein
LAGEEMLAWMTQLVIIVFLVAITIATNLFWAVWWWWWTPPIARKFTWLKRHKRSIIEEYDDAGWQQYRFPEELIPEGAYRLKDDCYYALPKPMVNDPMNPMTQREQMASIIVQRRFIQKDLGVPIWIAYKGRLPLVSPIALAAASVPMQLFKQQLETTVEMHMNELIKYLGQEGPQQIDLVTSALASLKVELDRAVTNAPSTEKIVPQKVDCANIAAYIKTLPTEYQPPLVKFLGSLNPTGNSSEQITFIDASDVRRAVPRSYSPTIATAIAKNREHYGELKANKSIWDKALPVAIILGLGIILIIVFALAYQWFQPRSVQAIILFLHRFVRGS